MNDEDRKLVDAAIKLLETSGVRSQVSPVIGTLRKLTDPEAPRMIEDDWEEIGRFCKFIDYEKDYRIGDYKPIEFVGYGTVNMVIAGFDVDMGTDGKSASITWIADRILTMCHMRNSGHADGSELSTLMRLLPEMLPEDVRSLIVPVRKSHIVYHVTDKRRVVRDLEETVEYLWVPSASEVFEKYETMYLEKQRVREYESMPKNWWLRSFNSNADEFCVNSRGDLEYGGKLNEFGIVPCFCT